MPAPESSSLKTETPPPVETVNVKIDGRTVAVPKTMPDPVTGRPVPTTMIQACALARVDVPHYCYHPRLPVAGNCRMCLVEFGMPVRGPDRQPLPNEDGTPQVRKSPRPAIACATPIAPDMEIYTDTPEVKQMREGVLEFLLINHPLDCPICDQAGECKLQEYSVDYGQSASRFVETKVHKPKRVDLGPRIVLDDERCILCSRCVRFTRDIVGDDALGFVNRGSYNTLTNFPGRPFDNNYTLNTVDICPVGALTSKDFRFQMRVWFLKETKSLCTSCGTGCNILIGSRQEKVLRYEPRDNDAVNASWMCDAGRLNYKWIHRADRLDAIKVRGRDGAVQDGHWSTVLAEIAGRLKEVPRKEAAVIASCRQTNEELYLLSRIASRLEAISETVPRKGEADQLLVAADRNPNTTGAQLAGLTGKRPGANLSRIAKGIEEERIKALVVAGEDVTAHGIGPELLEKLDLLVVTDILPNPTTERAHYLLPGCAHAEKRGTFTNIKGRVQKFTKAVEPPGDARPEWEFLAELWQHLAGEAGLPNFDWVFQAMCAGVPAFRDVRWADLGDNGVSVELG